MKKDRLNFIPRNFIKYKFFNSLFLGLSVGSIFTIYAPLKPSIYSIGGIILALGMLFLARIYTKIMTREWFYKISLFVEFVVLAMVIYFLMKPYLYMTALLVYIGYQTTFVFGSYLVRAETIIGKKRIMFTFFDTAKQLGYLVGMVVSFVFYKILDLGFGITVNSQKVYDLHFLLLICELLVIWFLYKSFQIQQTTFK
jgi:hypothetical protein